MLELYDSLEDPALSREEVLWGVNVHYLRAVLQRQALFTEETVQATGVLAVGDHYALGALVCLLLLCAPLFHNLFRGEDLNAFFRRSRAAGVPGLLPCALALGLVWAAYLLLFWGTGGALIRLLGGRAWDVLLPAACCAALAAGITGLCAALCPAPAGAGLLCLGITGLAALTAGCLLPPAMLPAPLRALGVWSPVTWMRRTLAAPLGYDPVPRWPIWLAGAALCLLTLLLTALRQRREGAGARR